MKYLNRKYLGKWLVNKKGDRVQIRRFTDRTLKGVYAFWCPIKKDIIKINTRGYSLE